jgi:hypothetical protein
VRTNLLTTILVALAGGTETEACITAPGDGTCPRAKDVTPYEMCSLDWRHAAVS